MNGKVCLITGATSGIGAAAAEALASEGATIVLVGRDRSRCEATAARLRQQAPGAPVDFLIGDLSVRSDVHGVAREFLARHDRLHVLINNASAIFLRRVETADGIEATFALNHLGYFLLTNLLFERLAASAPARVINVGSSGHKRVKALDFEDLQNRRLYRGFQAYYQSKFANLLFTYELARRMHGTGVTVNALHPGMVTTNIGKNNGWIWGVLKPIGDRLFGFKYVTAEEGARTVVYLAASPDVEGVSGQYFVEERKAESSAASHDTAAARRLWQISEQLSGLSAGTFDDTIRRARQAGSWA